MRELFKVYSQKLQIYQNIRLCMETIVIKQEDNFPEFRLMAKVREDAMVA